MSEELNEPTNSQFDVVFNAENTGSADDNEFQSPLSSDIEYISSDEDIFSSEVPEIQKGLAQWASECNIARNHTDKLLKVLNSCNVPGLPQCSKTLMSTPREVIVPRKVSPGEYVHFGIRKYFLKCTNPSILEMKEVSIDIGIDGLPLFEKSGQQKLWTIIGAFSKQKNIPLFLIGSYAGPNAPKSSCEFLKDFVEEAKKLQDNGILVGSDSVPRPFQIRLLSCDAPARAFISGTKGHSAKQGCSKCCQIGKKFRNTGIIFNTEIKQLRTDHSFDSRQDPGHHLCQFQTKKSALEKLGIGMVSQIPIDAMHLLDLGIARKILLRLSTFKSVGYRPDIKKISENLLSYSDYIPSEFQRKPRSLHLLHFWKATEFRQFVLYTGVVALKNNVSDDIYYHFLTLHCAYRIFLCQKLSESCIESAQSLIENFVENFSYVYGSDQISYNVHNMLHISDCVRQFGPGDSFSTYRFENYMQSLKKKIRKPNQILQQLYNRITEKFCIDNDAK